MLLNWCCVSVEGTSVLRRWVWVRALCVCVECSLCGVFCEVVVREKCEGRRW